MRLWRPVCPLASLPPTMDWWSRASEAASDAAGIYTLDPMARTREIKRRMTAVGTIARITKTMQ